jgi:uncharacterized protein DUF4157/putative peptidoglycan binding protein
MAMLTKVVSRMASPGCDRRREASGPWVDSSVLKGTDVRHSHAAPQSTRLGGTARQPVHADRAARPGRRFMQASGTPRGLEMEAATMEDAVIFAVGRSLGIESGQQEARAQSLPRTTDSHLPSLSRGGEPLESTERAFFEPLFDFDLSNVRVHSDSGAVRSAMGLNADAYTFGSDILFDAGRHSRRSDSGRRLLAHELAHVVQQSGGNSVLSPSPMAIQRRIGDGHDLASPWLAGDVELEGAFDNETAHFLRRGSRGTAVIRIQQLLFFLGFDIGPHGADGVFGPDTETAVRTFQASFAPPVDGIIGPITIGALDVQANRPEANRVVAGAVPKGPPTGRPPSISVDRIDLIDGPVGAIGGFPPITHANLNVPGPFNSPTEVNNSLQVHFHLDHGASANLTPTREIQRTATMAGGVVLDNPPDEVLPPGVAGPVRRGGFAGTLIANDGPAAHEIQRPDAHTIVVADAPGLAPLVPANYPVTYRAHFILTMNSTVGAPIARANYDVLIDKRLPAELPNTQNQAVVTAKRDFVRGKNL